MVLFSRLASRVTALILQEPPESGIIKCLPRCPSGPALRPKEAMKQSIHPKYTEIDVACSCGNKFKTSSTVGKAIHIEVCSVCHPFYTGKQKVMDTAGRIDKFRQRYGTKGARAAS